METVTVTTANGHGGARAGCGRKKGMTRAETYEPVVYQIEAMIVAALPQIIESLIKQAVDGDSVAARYLCDRILGKPAANQVPTCDDVTVAYADREPGVRYCSCGQERAPVLPYKTHWQSEYAIEVSKRLLAEEEARNSALQKAET